LLAKIKITLKSLIIRVASSLLSLSTTKLDAETDGVGVLGLILLTKLRPLESHPRFLQYRPLSNLRKDV